MLLFAKKRKNHLRLGALGEDSACKLLRAKGFEILARNFRVKYGELDIVALDGETIVFVEVKTLRRINKFRPIDNYKRKQNLRNIRAAKEYLRRISYPKLNYRFDFIEVVRNFYSVSEICHYENFFLVNLK